MRRLGIEVAKIAISAGLLWFTFTKIDTSSAWVMLGSIPAGAIGAVIAILTFQLLVAALRLHYLLRLVGTPIRFISATDAVFVGSFFSQTFVSFIGGDAMRVWRLAIFKVSIADAVKAVLLDRVTGFAGLFVLIVLGLPMLFAIVGDPVMRASVLAAVSAGLLGTVALLLVHRMPERFKRWRVLRIAAEVSGLALGIFARPGDASSVLGLSIVIQASNAIAIFAIAKGLGVHAELPDLLVLIPPVLLLAILPVSFAGWGIREGAMAVALGLVGISAEQSVAMSICFGLSLVVVALPGGLIWLISDGKSGRHGVRGS